VCRVRLTRTNNVGQPIGPPLPDWTARAVPAPTELRGRYCRLVPLAVEHAAGLFAAVTQDATGRQWTYLAYGPFSSVEEFTGFVRATIADPGYLTLTVLDATTGAPLGWAGYMRIEPAIGSVEVGGITFGSGDRSCERDPLHAATLEHESRLMVSGNLRPALDKGQPARLTAEVNNQRSGRPDRGQLPSTAVKVK